MAGRLNVGVGAFKPEMCEIGEVTLSGSALYADEPEGAKHEAGDFIQAKVDWSLVKSLANALKDSPDVTRLVVFKTVGTAAWDLATARVAVDALATL